MRIVDVAAFYSPEGGGVKTYIDRKLKAGPTAGHEIWIIAPGEGDYIEERGPNARIQFLEQPKFPLDRKYHYFRDGIALNAALDAAEPDLVEASSPWRSARLVGEWPGRAPRTLIMHADPLSAYAYRWFGAIASRPTIDKQFGWFWRHLLRLDKQFDGTVTASKALSDRLIEGGMTNVVTNPMGVTPGVYSPAHRDEALRTRLLAHCELPPEATLMLGIGRHHSEKRWTTVIEAVTAAGADAPIGFVLVGDGRDRASIVRAAEGNPHIHLVSPIGDREQLARMYASADIMLHGGDAETFCMVAAEGRASGLPLIGPDAGAIVDHIHDSDGWMYKAGDAADAVRAIRDFLATPREEVRARATALAADVRIMDTHFAELFAYYETLVAQGRRTS